MKTRIVKLLACLMVLLLTSGPIGAHMEHSIAQIPDAVEQVKGDSVQAFYQQDVNRSIERRMMDNAAEESGNTIEGTQSGKNIKVQLTARQMLANLRRSGIGGEKHEAICLIAEMLFADGKETEFVAGVCGNVVCEGRNGMFERDWGGSTQRYLPGHMPGDPYKYDSKYGNKNIYDGMSLSAAYKMAKDLYYSYNWDTGKYKFGLGCVQWTHKRTITLIEYYMEEAGGSDTITYEQCVAAEMKFIDYELNHSETGAYEHWIAGDHKSQYKNEAARAGYCVAKYYERCHSDYYSMRASRAQEIYEVMMGKVEIIPVAASDADSGS